MKNIGTKLAAVAIALCASAAPSFAGKGGSAQLIQQAIASGSQDAIIAEVERTEGLICEDCVAAVTSLLGSDNYKLREVAGWWYAKRPVLLQSMLVTMKSDLVNGDSVHVRNAADFIGSAGQQSSLPALRAAYTRGGLSVDARLAIVRSIGVLANRGGNSTLVAAMGDSDASVRALAVRAWRDMRGQTTAAPVEALLGDADANVRAQAVAVVGAYRDTNVVSVLQQLVQNDQDYFVRHNAQWALGRMGQTTPAATTK
ncbi:MAG TPA: HEAT repeat domain-containing protein [Kofleriaceae bacterium]|nr:HEAT repeat domain-containing protein [Kofleriaceae bacterium]